MSKYIDLTAEMFNGAPTMAMDPKMDITWHCNLDTLGYNLSRLTTSTHQGTHMDAQRHFFNDGETIDKISLDRLITRAFKIDLPNKGAHSTITVKDIEPYAAKIEKGLNVVINTGWYKQFPKPEFVTDFPVFDKALADWFVDKKVGLVAMTVYKWKKFEDAVEIAKANLLFNGAGHSCSIQSNNKAHIEYAGEVLPVSRVLVNQSCASMNGGAFANGLNPTTTLGCGSWGNNSISENLTYYHLFNKSRIAYVKDNFKTPTDEEIFG